VRFDEVKHYKAEEFRRLTSVKLATFNKMVEIVTQALKEKKAKGGRPNKLSPPDMVLMTLEYLREYRTYFHISSSYGISESNCYYTIRFVEDTLIKSKCFSLRGRKKLLESDMEYEVVVIDVTESPIQRPKKSKNNSTQARKSDIP
jgi:Helix-turn-helix of DDE superfamily endonuclease